MLAHRLFSQSLDFPFPPAHVPEGVFNFHTPKAVLQQIALKNILLLNPYQDQAPLARDVLL